MFDRLVAMRAFILLFSIHMLFATLAFSQENEDTAVVLKKGNEFLYVDPIQTLKIGEHLIRSAKSTEEILHTNLLLAKANLIVGNYTQAVTSIKAALQIVQGSNDVALQVETYLLATEIYDFLNLFEIAKPYFAKAQQIAKGNLSLEKKVAVYDFFVVNQKKNHDLDSRFLTTLQEGNEIENAIITKGTPLLLTALYYAKADNKSEALMYFQKSQAALANKYPNSYWEMMVLLQYGSFLLEQKEYTLAEQQLLKSSKKANEIGNPHFLAQICGRLSNCYLALGNQTQFQTYKSKATEAETTVENQTATATNFAFEQLQKDAEAEILNTKSRQRYSNMTLVFFLSILVITWLVFRRIHHAKMKYLSDIMSYLKLIHQVPKTTIPIEKLVVKNGSIPKETEELLLAKLDKFERGKKYLNKDISLAQMASLFETNTKYLSEVINKHKGKNVNVYINELRVQYIVEKLKTDSKYLNYKVSYLAEECGFTSHSSFSAVFKNITGLTPNTFINFLNKDMGEIKKMLEV